MWLRTVPTLSGDSGVTVTLTPPSISSMFSLSSVINALVTSEMSSKAMDFAQR